MVRAPVPGYLPRLPGRLVTRGPSVNQRDTSAQLAQERVLRLVRRHLDPRVHHGQGRPGDDRIEVEVGDFGQVFGEPRDAEQQVAQGPEVGLGCSRVALRIILSASRSVSGASRDASPKVTSAPNTGSSATLTVTSVPGGARSASGIP